MGRAVEECGFPAQALPLARGDPGRIPQLLCASVSLEKPRVSQGNKHQLGRMLLLALGYWGAAK